MLLPSFDAQASSPLFHFEEERSSDLSTFPKWNKVLSKDKVMRNSNECSGECPKKAWQKSLKELATYSKPIEQLRQTNHLFNKHPYIEDMVNWGMTDYWAAPYEFLRLSGDCEDYAIIKFMALKELGWKPDAMRIVILNDRHLRILHAVLMVEHEGENYILDNQIEQLMSDEQIHHYEPIYSINETAWWRHLPK